MVIKKGSISYMKTQKGKLNELTKLLKGYFTKEIEILKQNKTKQNSNSRA